MDKLVVPFSEKDLRCKAGCEYYGNPQWQGFCSKCWRLYQKDIREKSSSAKRVVLIDELDQSLDVSGSKTWAGFTFDRLLESKSRSALSSPRASSIRAMLKKNPSPEISPSSSPGMSVSVLPGTSGTIVQRKLSGESMAAKESFSLFLNTLPKYISSEISKHVNLIVSGIFHDTSVVSIDELSEKVQDFYHTMSIRLQCIFKESPATAEEVLAKIETYICVRCYGVLFCPDTDEEVADLSLQDRIRSLHWVTCGAIDHGFDFTNKSVQDRFDKAVTEIIEMNSHRSPDDKLCSLTRCCKLIFENLKESRGELASADEFLPALIYVILKTNPPLILSNVKFISRFTLPSKLMSGEAGYYFTNLCCALDFIQNLNAESLKMHPQEFEAYTCGQLVPPLNRTPISNHPSLKSLRASLIALEDLRNKLEQLQDKIKDLDEIVRRQLFDFHQQIYDCMNKNLNEDFAFLEDCCIVTSDVETKTSNSDQLTSKLENTLSKDEKQISLPTADIEQFDSLLCLSDVRTEADADKHESDNS
ncbi:Rab5 GDP/GTP exchange factor [Trichinella papuae]|uniref:Rab5 GDP/GTP exchange factor n=1 Tax=Trichinella papuae TaxID=268474 RepID=A0A0V1N190_9BILA|nr:Rab5 GDP/GTP exchange factor [Trichinella papuae]